MQRDVIFKLDIVQAPSWLRNHMIGIVSGASYVQEVYWSRRTLMAIYLDNVERKPEQMAWLEGRLQGIEQAYVTCHEQMTTTRTRVGLENFEPTKSFDQIWDDQEHIAWFLLGKLQGSIEGSKFCGDKLRQIEEAAILKRVTS